MEYPAYQFKGLEQFARGDIAILNRASSFLAQPDELKEILKAVGDVLLDYDIFNLDDIEISLIVKPVGHIGKPQVRKLLQPAISIGRTNDNDVPLKSPIVSKKHALIFRRGLEYYLKDMESNNGTQLNQVRLEPGSEVVLKNEDVIKIDPFEIKVSLPVDVSIAKRPLNIEIITVRKCREFRAPRHVGIFMQVQPAGKTVALILDDESARWLIQKIFMGQESQGAWTEMESGLLEYMTCKILSTLNPFFRESRFILQNVSREEPEILKLLSNQNTMVEIAFGTRTEIGMVHAGLFLPAEFLADNKTEIDFLSRAPWISKRNYSFSVDVGAAYLSPEQITILEGGDIILLDRATVSFDGEKVEGKVGLHSSMLRRGVIQASLFSDGAGSAKITIDGVFQEGLRHMTEVKKPESAPAAEGVPEVLSSLEIPVIVEFARLNFTLEELSTLKEGQIIEFEKMPPEVVDLSVDGKVIASGKLVDVEGKLGVQIVRILKKV
ncbi:FliM/FliN family flagellar motor switch protein [bacterium]|nr:FliM/FliN family flagellar motor switch protein [bacterium]